MNGHGRIQRIGRAFPPLADSREDWRVLLEIARELDHPMAWRNPQEIFAGLARAVAPFARLSYETIGSQGVALDLPASAIDLARIGQSASASASEATADKSREGGPDAGVAGP